METLLNFFSSFFTGMVDRGDITPWQGFFLILFTSMALIAIWRFQAIWEFFRSVKGAKLEEYSHVLKEYPVGDAEKKCLETEISRIIALRLCGLRDRGRQRIALSLILNNEDCISPELIKKYRNNLELEDGKMILETGWSFRFEALIYAFFSLQYILLAALFIALSIFKGDALAIWGHILLWLMAMILFGFFMVFAKLIPLPGECRRLKKALDCQHAK